MNPVSEVGHIDEYVVVQLTRELAVQYVKDIPTLLNLIPKVHHTEEYIFCEEKDGRIFHGKWQHSLMVFDGDTPIAILVAYEREPGGHPAYDRPSIHIGSLAVSEAYQKQGIARRLLECFFERSTSFAVLKGEMNRYTIQTNSAQWNKHVRTLYESLGFSVVGEKVYDNRIDIVLHKHI